MRYHQEQYICCYNTCLCWNWQEYVCLFLSTSIFSKVMFEISRKLVWLGGLYIIPTIIGVVLGNRISKKIPLLIQQAIPLVFLFLSHWNKSSIWISHWKIDLTSLDSIIPVTAALVHSAIYITDFTNFWK